MRTASRLLQSDCACLCHWSADAGTPESFSRVHECILRPHWSAITCVAGARSLDQGVRKAKEPDDARFRVKDVPPSRLRHGGQSDDAHDHVRPARHRACRGRLERHREHHHSLRGTKRPAVQFNSQYELTATGPAAMAGIGAGRADGSSRVARASYRTSGILASPAARLQDQHDIMPKILAGFEDWPGGRYRRDRDAEIQPTIASLGRIGYSPGAARMRAIT